MNNDERLKKPETFSSKISQCFQAIFFFVLLTAYDAKAQVSSYTFSEALAAYTELTNPVQVAYAQPWDNHTNPAHLAPIGFSFWYDGNTYTECRISPNGFITFGGPATQPAVTNYVPLSNAGAYEGAVSALGINLMSADDDPDPFLAPYDIVYKTTGAAGNRIFTVQWKNARRTADPGLFNFQIKLRENGNVVEIHYGACAPEGTTNRTVQVGLRGFNNDFQQGNVQNRRLTTNVAWVVGSTTAGTANNHNLRTNELAFPDTGLIFRFTPTPACTTPTAFPTDLQIGATNITPTSFVDNSFTPASPAPTNYLVLRSLVNTPPNAALIPDRYFWAVDDIINGVYTVVSVSGATTFTQTGLEPQTRYYYWVIPYNIGCFGAPYYNLSNILTANQRTCFPPTTALAATNIEGNSFTANWEAVPGATNYRIDVSLSNTFATFLPGYNNLSVGTVTSLPITGLASLGTYYYRVRAIGAAGYCVVNSNTVTVNLPCGYYNIPYTQNFDAATVPVLGLPPCFIRSNENADVVQWGVQTVTFSSSPKAMFIAKNSSLDMDDWFFLPGLNLTGGVSYRLFFRYNTNSGGVFHENLRVRLGTDQNVTGMNETLLDLANINNTSFNSIHVDFTPVTDGVYYIGFHGYSLADQSYIAIDDISVTESPTCFEPTNIQIVSVGTNTATISWTDAIPSPSNGYQYYVSTSPTPPTGGTTPTGSVGAGITTANITGLNASSFYYVWVRGNCGGSRSVWSQGQTFSTECNPPLVTSSSGAVRCGTGSVTLAATPNAGSSISWFDVPTGGVPIASGNTFLTPEISSTTTYYAEAKAFGATALAGPVNPASIEGLIDTDNFQVSTIFTVFEGTTLQSVDIFPIASGQPGQLVLRNEFNVTVATFPFTTSVSGGNTPQTIMLNHPLLPGLYNLYVGVMPASGLRINSTGAIYPYMSSVANITGNNFDSSQYYYLYNWKFTTECYSPRIAVQATVTTPPALSISSSAEEICFGESTPLITLTGYASYNNFVWSPSTGVSGTPATGFTFSPSGTTTYTLTASQSSGAMCSNTVEITVTVNPIPPDIIVLPGSVTICENDIQSLTASVGVAEVAVIFNENFNGATNSWTVANTSIAGDTNASQWTLRQSVYAYSSQYWNTNFSSNDASQFYLANADAQGGVPGTLTRTTLTSPSINLAGYVSASLSFWHYLRYVSGDQFHVQVSTDGGATWNIIRTFMSTQGAASNFVNADINLDAYVGFSDVKIRFSFQSGWGYGWAIDNVQISAGLSLAVLWSPEDGLYEDELATIPYVAGTALGVVYAKPDTSTTYTATAMGTNGCSTSTDVTIQVDPKPIGGILSSGTQVLCGSQTPSDITLTGYSGTIVRWESADDAAFTTGVTPIANTTDILTSAQMGSITTIKYFRAVVGNGVCSEEYSDVISVSYPVTIWNGTSWSDGFPNSNTKVVINVASSYTFVSDLEACSLEVLSGNITVAPGVTFDIENEVIVSGGSLIFENNSSLLQHNGTTSDNTGAITYKRNTTGMWQYDFTYWSSPVSNQDMYAFSPFTQWQRFYTFDGGVTNNWVQVFPNLGSFAPGSRFSTAGVGFIVRAPGGGLVQFYPFGDPNGPTVFEGIFSGVPNNGDVTVTGIDGNGPNFGNFIGNPYPSAIDIHAFLLDPANTNVDGTIYLWTHNTPITNNVYNADDFATYNFSGMIGTPALNPGINNATPGRYISAGQGFFIDGINSVVNGSVVFRNAHRVAGNNSLFFRTAAGSSNYAVSSADALESLERNRIWLNMTNGVDLEKQLLVGYIESATDGYDRGFDGKIAHSGYNLEFYSLQSDNKLAIQARSLPFSVTDEVPLGYNANTAGNYNIYIHDMDGFFPNQEVYLEDKYLNVIHDLKDSPYSFTTESGTSDNRFVLRYTNETLSTGTPQLTGNTVVVYKNNGVLYINTGNSTMQEVSLYDVRGRLLANRKDIHATDTSFSDLMISEQVLLVHITDVNGNKVTKKVVF